MDIMMGPIGACINRSEIVPNIDKTIEDNLHNEFHMTPSFILTRTSMPKQGNFVNFLNHPGNFEYFVFYFIYPKTLC